MTLQPPSAYQPPEPEPSGSDVARPADYPNVSGVAPAPGPQAEPDLPPEPRQESRTGIRQVLGNARTLSAPPLGLDVVGGTNVRLNRVVALDRLASGFGFLTLEWPAQQRGYDLLALHDQASISARGSAITVDLSVPLGRVLIATGTRGTTTLAPSSLRVTNGATHLDVPIDGGVSLGVWPRLTIARVDEFVVIRHEQDPLSGNLTAVSKAYGYDERNFTLARFA